MRRFITSAIVTLILAISVHDVVAPEFVAAQPADCVGRGRHCMDIEECGDPGGLVDAILSILGFELEVCTTNHYYYP